MWVNIDQIFKMSIEHTNIFIFMRVLIRIIWTLVVGQHWFNFQFDLYGTCKYIYCLCDFSSELFKWFDSDLGTKSSDLNREVWCRLIIWLYNREVCCRLIIWLYNLGTKSSDLGREVCCRLYLVCGCYTQLNQNIRRLCQWRGL